LLLFLLITLLHSLKFADEPLADFVGVFAPGSRLRSRRPSRPRVHDESFKPNWFKYSIIRSFVVAACFAAALLERLLTWLFRLISPRRPQA